MLVKTITLQSVLQRELTDQVQDSVYRFCETPTCDIVYYHENHEQIFYKNNLLVRVGIKEKSIPMPVCYCFSHNIEGIELEIKKTGKSLASEDISERLQHGCWCDTRNPAGRCCLGSIRKIEKEFLEKYDPKLSTVDEH